MVYSERGAAEGQCFLEEVEFKRLLIGICPILVDCVLLKCIFSSCTNSPLGFLVLSSSFLQTCIHCVLYLCDALWRMR